MSFPRLTANLPDGRLAALVRAAAGAAARRPRRTIALWLALVAACIAGGAITGTDSLTNLQSGTGESRQASERLHAAGLEQPAVERVLVRSHSAAASAAAVRDLAARLERRHDVRWTQAPAGHPRLLADGGRAALLRVALRGDPQDAADHVAGVERAVAATARAHPGTTLSEAGPGSMGHALDEVVSDGLGHAELVSVPLTLVILALAFGALLAAVVPLLLGITAVAAALGALGVVSQLVPASETTATVIVLIGLAVGVDYSLFYIRREREERRAGRGPGAALDLAAATVGRAVLVSGLTVMVALAGLLFSGLAVFSSIAIGTMLVAAIAVAGSLTVLPATLSLLGARIDRGRIPGLGRMRARSGGGGAWRRLAAAVTRRPRAALLAAVCVLGALAAPALALHTSDLNGSDLPADTPVMVAQRAIERDFPGAPADAQLVVAGAELGSAQARARLAALGHRARALTGADGAVSVAVSRDGRTARVSLPMPDRGARGSTPIVERLRQRALPAVERALPGTHAMLTGAAAANADVSGRLAAATPLVIGFVLALAFALLCATFGSPALAAAVIGLNLLSVGAAYGVLVGVFQHSWAQGLLGFDSAGAIVNWLPLFMFVILFGLSMDYTVLVLERIREARRAGHGARRGAAEGIAATAGSVTSAAVVMISVFSVFATLPLLEMKQFGVGLAAAVAIDATIVRGVALPAAVALLGERRWRVPRRRAGAVATEAS